MLVIGADCTEPATEVFGAYALLGRTDNYSRYGLQSS